MVDDLPAGRLLLALQVVPQGGNLLQKQGDAGSFLSWAVQGRLSRGSDYGAESMPVLFLPSAGYNALRLPDPLTSPAVPMPEQDVLPSVSVGYQTF